MNERKIVEYRIVKPTDSYGNIDDDRIVKMLSDGWQPLGGLCAYNTANNNNSLYQVMVKYDS